MTNKDLKAKMFENEDLHINEVISALKNDPNAEDRTKNYEELREYLRELIDKNGSLMYGIINALERYLEK